VESRVVDPQCSPSLIAWPARRPLPLWSFLNSSSVLRACPLRSNDVVRRLPISPSTSPHLCLSALLVALWWCRWRSRERVAATRWRSVVVQRASGERERRRRHDSEAERPCHSIHQNPLRGLDALSISPFLVIDDNSIKA
jgi:hypothetical protein